MSSPPDLLILGAGAAGIAAAREAAARGLSCLVLEARGRAGGRAATDNATLGAPFDLGATWLHQANSNPLVPLAREAGFRLLNHDEHRAHRLRVGDRWAGPAEEAAFDAAYDRWLAAVRDAPAEPDRPVAAVAPRGGYWDASIAAWEGPTIAATELHRIGVADFLSNQLDPPNLLPEAGCGTLLAALAAPLPIRLGCPVEKLEWGAAGGVRASGAWGSVSARAAVVTLPVGVLAAGGLRFDPPLPVPVQEAIGGLPMGLLLKLGLRAAGEDRLDLPPFCGLDRRVEEGERRMAFIAWPFGRDHLEGFAGGELAWELERAGEGAAVAHALDELTGLFGSRARRAVSATGAAVSRWGSDPFARGAYSYARPGAAAARRVLAEPLFGGRLVFAGEHCHPSLAGTLGGAWETGLAAARHVAAALRPGEGDGGSAGGSCYTAAR
ncbi:flavin monoamine oxidase family protein [Roseomonas sp. BN140053]|uniref:flavin monoamine oxidase family protein n=1 Tax=Roseomonas sp. BN140053 TaxID=3391898 RepID=UPI0039ED6298